MRRTQRKNQTKPQRDPSAPLRVVIVTRLSRSKRKTNADGERGLDFTSHETQEAGCRAKALKEGWEVVQVLQDDDIGGDRESRPGLDAAIHMIRSGEADALLVHSMERLARDQILQMVLLDKILKAGGQLFSVKEDLTTDATGIFMLNVVTYAGQMELERIRERVNRANNARYAQPKRYRAAKPLLGYTKKGKGANATYEVNEKEAETVRRVFELTAAGLSQRAIAKRFTEERVPGSRRWSTSVISGILNREVYWTGKHECWKTKTIREYGKPAKTVEREVDRYFFEMPAIVDPAIALRAQSAIKRNPWKTRRDDRDPAIGILRYGFAVCSGCHRALSVVLKGRGEGFRYRCSNPNCSSQVSMEVSSLDGGITEWVKDVILNPTRAASRYEVKEETPKLDPELQLKLAEAEAEVADVTKKANGLVSKLAMIEGPIVKVFQDQIAALNTELEAATEKRDKLAEQVAKQTGPTKRKFRRVSPETTISKACQTALKEGWEAYREWVETNDCGAYKFSYLGEPSFNERLSADEWVVKEGAILPNHASPAGWQAWQAVLSTLDVEVTLNQERQETPRWEARMMLPDGDVIWNMPATSRSRWP
jgi:DNA invertase Pin-like site-specific DNA recombinase